MLLQIDHKVIVPQQEGTVIGLIHESQQALIRLSDGQSLWMLAGNLVPVRPPKREAPSLS